MNKKMPVISVLVPTKNRGESIRETFNSLASQTYKDFEVVVVDGGSTDNTKETILGFCFLM